MSVIFANEANRIIHSDGEPHTRQPASQVVSTAFEAGRLNITMMPKHHFETGRTYITMRLTSKSKAEK